MGASRWIRRERAALSVTDGRRGQLDDEHNFIRCVGFPIKIRGKEPLRTTPSICGLTASNQNILGPYSGCIKPR